NASAVGYYGDQGGKEVTEQTPPGTGFLADLCKQWEAEARRAEEFGARVVAARIGIVLAEEGGALKQMPPAFRMGVGGKLGSGAQWVPWIHRWDVIKMLVWLLENRSARGPFNVPSPHPATMSGLARAIGKVLHRPSIFPVPPFMLKLVVGELAESIL